MIVNLLRRAILLRRSIFSAMGSKLGRGSFHNTRLPKGPVRTKNSTESKFTTAREKRYGNSETLRIVLRSAPCSRKERQENGTDTEKLRRQQNTTDSGAVLFLVRKGPLGLRRVLRRFSKGRRFLEGFLDSEGACKGFQ